MSTQAPGRAATSECLAPPRAPGSTTLAPGPSAGLLVATHFVYSMALKRCAAAALLLYYIAIMLYYFSMVVGRAAGHYALNLLDGAETV